MLARIGFYSYDIYLLHVIVGGHPLSLLVGRLRPSAPSVYCWFVAVALATMLIPMVIGRIIRRFPRLAFVALGLPGREAVSLPGKEGLGGRPEPDSVWSLPGGIRLAECLGEGGQTELALHRFHLATAPSSPSGPAQVDLSRTTS
ncbi:MAG TPA: hypothetical protein PKY77_06035 [Phycisphaerae bacterium]|nr:hypothetical protein [Phycisphaerae bacterium]HRY68995.1 hypothetical protein [Phycisphaerae bacterium]HSA26031.1 hypothetical protein [Phycisphaerae bacterium]